MTDPMAIFGDMRQAEWDELIRRGIAAGMVLGASATAVMGRLGIAVLAIWQCDFGNGLLAVAPWMTLLNLQHYWRRIGFKQEKPIMSLRNAFLFNGYNW